MKNLLDHSQSERDELRVRIAKCNLKTLRSMLHSYGLMQDHRRHMKLNPLRIEFLQLVDAADQMKNPKPLPPPPHVPARVATAIREALGEWAREMNKI